MQRLTVASFCLCLISWR